MKGTAKKKETGKAAAGFPVDSGISNSSDNSAIVSGFVVGYIFPMKCIKTTVLWSENGFVTLFFSANIFKTIEYQAKCLDKFLENLVYIRIFYASVTNNVFFKNYFNSFSSFPLYNVRTVKF